MDPVTFNIGGGDWQLTHVVESPLPNFRLARAGGQHFHIVMVEDEFVGPDGSTGTFRQPLIIEHDQGKDKIGDVVIQLRKHPVTGRWMIQVEQETVFEDETTRSKTWRTARSSVDNPEQSVKKTVEHSGWLYSNPRRIGGKPIKTHFITAGWSPQLADSMMDVSEYVDCMDSMGLATFLKALKRLSSEEALEIFMQIRE